VRHAGQAEQCPVISNAGFFTLRWRSEALLPVSVPALRGGSRTPLTPPPWWELRGTAGPTPPAPQRCLSLAIHEPIILLKT